MDLFQYFAGLHCLERCRAQTESPTESVTPTQEKSKGYSPRCGLVFFQIFLQNPRSLWDSSSTIFVPNWLTEEGIVPFQHGSKGMFLSWWLQTIRRHTLFKEWGWRQRLLRSCSYLPVQQDLLGWWLRLCSWKLHWPNLEVVCLPAVLPK